MGSGGSSSALTVAPLAHQGTLTLILTLALALTLTLTLALALTYV